MAMRFPARGSRSKSAVARPAAGRSAPDRVAMRHGLPPITQPVSALANSTKSESATADGAGSLHAFRRAAEGKSGDRQLELEEYSHFGMVARFSAGAARLPFWPLRNYMGTDLPSANPFIRSVKCPYTGEKLATVPALNPDVTIVHAQRADASGNTQIWGLLGVQKEAAFASQRVIVVVEELVDESVIRSDPNRTSIPGTIVDAVVVEPWGAHPSYAQ